MSVSRVDHESITSKISLNNCSIQIFSDTKRCNLSIIPSANHLRNWNSSFGKSYSSRLNLFLLSMNLIEMFLHESKLLSRISNGAYFVLKKCHILLLTWCHSQLCLKTSFFLKGYNKSIMKYWVTKSVAFNRLFDKKRERKENQSSINPISLEDIK